jgi:hypothetical protein
VCAIASCVANNLNGARRGHHYGSGDAAQHPVRKVLTDVSAHENQVRRPLPREKRYQVPGITPRYHYFCWNADLLKPLDGDGSYLFTSPFHFLPHSTSPARFFAPHVWWNIRVCYNRKYVRCRARRPRADSHGVDKHLSRNRRIYRDQ